MAQTQNRLLLRGNRRDEEHGGVAVNGEEGIERSE